VAVALRADLNQVALTSGGHNMNTELIDLIIRIMTVIDVFVSVLGMLPFLLYVVQFEPDLGNIPLRCTDLTQSIISAIKTCVSVCIQEIAIISRHVHRR
jgi:hypothetical protein